MGRPRGYGLPGRAVLCGLLLGTSTAGAAPPAPVLAETTLYATTVHGCQTVDLAAWRHPTRDVLQAARATVEKVELCNAGRFPVFTVNLPYDPDGQTGSYFSRLFADLAEANGFWSYAVVDLADDVVITVTVQRGNRALLPSYEDFSPPG